MTSFVYSLEMLTAVLPQAVEIEHMGRLEVACLVALHAVSEGTQLVVVLV